MLKSELLTATKLSKKDLDAVLVDINRADLIDDENIPDDIAFGILDAQDRIERNKPAPDAQKLNGSEITLSPEDAIANNQTAYNATVASIMNTFIEQAIDLGAAQAEVYHSAQQAGFTSHLSNLRSRSAQEHLNREANALKDTVETLDLVAECKKRGIDPNESYASASNLQTQTLADIRNRVEKWNQISNQ